MSIHQRFNVSHMGPLSALVGGATVHAAGLDDDTGIVALQVETPIPERAPSPSALRANNSRFNGLLMRIAAAREDERAPMPTKSKRGKKPATAPRRASAARVAMDPRLAPTPRTRRRLAQVQKKKPATKLEMRYLRGQLATIALKQMGAMFPGSPEGYYHPDYLENVWRDPYGRPVRYYELLKKQQPVAALEPKPAPTKKTQRKPKKVLWPTPGFGGVA